MSLKDKSAVQFYAASSLAGAVKTQAEYTVLRMRMIDSPGFTVPGTLYDLTRCIEYVLQMFFGEAQISDA